METTTISVIECDVCKKEINPKELEFLKDKVTLEGTEFEVVGYKCPECGKVYVVCMLDYWGKKLQDRYLAAMDNYRKCYNKTSSIILQQKLSKVEHLKKEAMEYQHQLLSKYGETLPEGLFL